MTILERAREAIGDIQAANADGKITMAEAWRILGSVIQAAAAVVDALEDRDAGYEQTVEAAEAAFDELIQPLDIANVPDWLESNVKAMVRSQIRPALMAMYDALDAAA